MNDKYLEVQDSTTEEKLFLKSSVGITRNPKFVSILTYEWLNDDESVAEVEVKVRRFVSWNKLSKNLKEKIKEELGLDFLRIE